MAVPDTSGGAAAVVRVVGVVPAGPPGLAGAADTLQWSRARRRPKTGGVADAPADEDGDGRGYAWDALVRRADEWRAERVAAAREGRDDDDGTLPRMPLANGVSVPGGGPTILEFLFTAMPRGVGADAVALRPPDLPHGPRPLPGPPDVLPRALAAFWTHHYVVVPVIHRPAFEAAMRGSGSTTGASRGTPELASIYRTRPMALMYAMAANAVRLVPTLDAAEKRAYAVACFERCRDLLLSRQTDDLESAQALFLLVGLLALAGVPGKTLPLLRRTVATAQALYLGLPRTRPKSAAEWIARELVLRLRLGAAMIDYGASYSSGATQTMGSYFFPHGLELPRSEAYFFHAHPEEAFALLQQKHPDPEVVEIPAQHGWDGSKAICGNIARRAFRGNASIFSLILAYLFVRHVEISSRKTSERASGDSRLAALAMPALVDSLWDAFPPEYLGPLRAGDPGPLLADSSSVFAHPHHASVAVQFILMVEEHAFGPLIQAGFKSAAAARVLRFTSILEGLLDWDPNFATIPFFVIAAVFKGGTVLLGAAKTLSGPALPGETKSERAERKQRRRDLESGVRTVARALNGLAEHFGMAARAVDASFARLMREAGVSEASGSVVVVDETSDLTAGPDSTIEDEDVPGKDTAVFFADVLMREEAGKSPANSSGRLSDVGSAVFL
ncbi:hypothetical protein DFJ74DRAFT_356651 [Hyaloraphidium curvatum]|nr:hypothetical protein DFJ74DRAFT_356651 [Hyaloraphidium curvatum]